MDYDEKTRLLSLNTSEFSKEFARYAWIAAVEATRQEMQAEIDKYKSAYNKMKHAYSFKCSCEFITESIGRCGECMTIAEIEKELTQEKDKRSE